jgi:hypothetical protein
MAITNDRPKLDLILAGDTLAITRLDRLSRSVQHLINLGAELRAQGVGLHVIEQGIDTATIEGRAMFGMLSVLAELLRTPYIPINPNKDGLPSGCVLVGPGTPYASIEDIPAPRPDFICSKRDTGDVLWSDWRRRPASYSAGQCYYQDMPPQSHICPSDCILSDNAPVIGPTPGPTSPGPLRRPRSKAGSRRATRTRPCSFADCSSRRTV